MKRIFSAILLIGLSGCSSTPVNYYEGPTRSSNETATISLWTDHNESKGDFFPADLGIKLVSVNETPFTTNESISILPGDYTVKVMCTFKGESNQKVFKIDAKATKNYAIITYVSESMCKFKNLNLLINNERFEEL